MGFVVLRRNGRKETLCARYARYPLGRALLRLANSWLIVPDHPRRPRRRIERGFFVVGERRFVPTTYFSLTTNEYNSSRTCTVSSHNTSPPLLEITFGHRFIQSENFYLSFIFYTIKYVSFLIFVKYSFFFFFFGKSRKFIFSCWFERQGWNNERRVSKDINGNVRKRRRRAVC